MLTAAVLSVGSPASWSILRRLGKERVEAQGSGHKYLNSPTSTYSEVKLSVVTYLTNSIVDEILQELYHSHKSLVNILSPRGLRPSLCSAPFLSLQGQGSEHVPQGPVDACPSSGPAPDPAEDTVGSTRRGRPRARSIFPRQRQEP